MRPVITCIAVLLLLAAQPSFARADYEDGARAFERGDFAAALAAWRPLAEEGDREAQLRLGILYEKGQGVQRDLVEAHKWYVLAWKRDQPGARQRALAARRSLTKTQFEVSRQRIRDWLDAFATREPDPKPAAAGDITAFYEKAHKRTQAPPENSRLRVFCSAKIRDVHVTFVTADGKQVLIVALTPRPLRSPSKNVWLRPMFTRSLQATSGSTADWAYVFDRNGDGKVDYLTYLEGPSPVIPSPRTRKVERMIKPESVSHAADRTNIIMSGEQFKFSLGNTQLVFWHLADDNFDGAADAYAVPTRDRATGLWVDGHVLVRSSKLDGNFDHCRFVPGAVGTPPARCQRSQERYVVPGKRLIGLLDVPPDDNRSMLRLINGAARRCGLTRRHFRTQ